MTAPPDTCRNCGTHATQAYCPACGQNTAPHPPTLAEFIHEFIAHYVALEGKLWKTLATLLFIPGGLTRDYLRGRKARYINPLRLYLTFSVLLFAAMNLSGHVVRFVGTEEELAPSQRAQVDRIKELIELKPAPRERDRSSGWFQRRLDRFLQMSAAERVVQVRAGLQKYTPYALFFLVPVLALLLKISYLNRRMLYGEHLVAAFHAQTVLFIFGIVLTLDPPNWLLIALTLALAAHGVIALKRVYGGRWWPTLLRALALSAAYMLALALTLYAVIVAAVAV